MKCPGCGGKAQFADGEALGSYRHKPGCKYDFEALVTAARDPKPSGVVEFRLTLPERALVNLRRLQELTGKATLAETFRVLLRVYGVDVDVQEKGGG